MDRLHIATLNIRNLADRWDERLPLILADMAALQPDILGLQEVVYVLQQDRLIGAAGAGRYESVRGWAGRPEYGNALLVREPLVGSDVERLDLGLSRSATRARVAMPSGATVAVVVTHLHHVPADEGVRDEQASVLLDWLDSGASADGLVVVGDFNAEPLEPAYRRMTDVGFRSSFREANDREPDVTWPSGLEAPAKDADGEPGCLDYVWVRGAIGVESCRLAFDRPAVGDPGLYPSDHLGLSARLTVG
ncbi:MAG TPA: endonuclease/exonuclease/phosphatase family protein [Candidatus Bathyarchaeia archaeon]|jgi:nocturnin|nr:endonuclease/exonuclease/phosphatase family protein [Candidatus Bathyarchaeia archaeon]